MLRGTLRDDATAAPSPAMPRRRPPDGARPGLLTGVLAVVLALFPAPFLAVVPGAVPPAKAVVDPDNRPGKARAPYAVIVLANPDAGVYEPSLYCTGALVAPDVVLTAGHCASGLDSSQLYVGAGSENVRDAAVYPVKNLVVHPRFNPDADSWLDPLAHDIAVLLLATPVTGVRPIRLAPGRDAPLRGPRSNLRAYGWGIDATGESTGWLGRSALEDLTGIVASPYPLDETSQILTGSRSGALPCVGDSGGPLVGNRPGKKVPFLVGLVSFGSQECRPGMPVVHTRIAAYRPWIDQAVSALRTDGGTLRYRSVDRSWNAPEGTGVLTGELVSTRTHLHVTLTAPDIGQTTTAALRLRVPSTGMVLDPTDDTGRHGTCPLERDAGRRDGALTWGMRVPVTCLGIPAAPGTVLREVLAELVRDDGAVLEEIHFTRVLVP